MEKSQCIKEQNPHAMFHFVEEKLLLIQKKGKRVE